MASEQEIIAAQAAEIERLKNKVASLEDQLYWLRKKMFGRMSEKNLPLDPTVLCEPGLFDEPLTDEERASLDAAIRKDEEDTANVNGNCECSNFGKIACSVFSNNSTSFSVTTMQQYL